MTRAGLIEALRRRAAEDAQALWREARTEAAAGRAAAQRDVDAERASLDAQTAAAARRAARDADAEADRALRDEGTRAAGELGERLRGLARAELAALRAAAPEALVTALAAELPERAWARVCVHPDDAAVARRLFPGATVDGDPAITGGLRAEADGGRVVVDNTLEARLESAWPDLLPALVHDILTESSDDRPAA